MEFRNWLESNWTSSGVSDQPFTAGGNAYILRFSLRPTHIVFPYSPFGGGQVAEIVWFPAERDDSINDDKYIRTNTNTLTQVREILTVLPTMIRQWVLANKPVGFYWKGDDARLASIWARMARGHDFASFGYVPAKYNQKVFVQQQLKPMLDEIDGF